jgi:biopolymer transport protein ExbB
MTPLIELFVRGGPVMFFIAGISLIAWYLILRTWMAAGVLLRNMQSIRAPLLQSLSRRNGTPARGPQLEGRLDDSVISLFGIESQTVRLKRTLGFIGMLAALLPLLGLLGTVLGMLVSFEVISLHGTSQPRLLAGGIGQALITTQAGLWTAVPVLFFYHIIRSRVRLINNEIEVMSHVLQAGSSDEGGR